MARLYFVAGTSSDEEESMELFAVANDAFHAVDLWMGHFAGWPFPDTVMVYALEDIQRETTGVVLWNDLPGRTVRVPRKLS